MATVLQNLRGWTIVTHFSLVLSDLSTYFGWYYITANTNTESVGMSGIWNNQNVYIQCWQGAAAMGDLPNCWMLLQKLRTRTLEHQRSKELFGIYGKNATEYECKLLNCVTPTSKRVPLPVPYDFNHCYFSIPCSMSTLLVPSFAGWQEFHFPFHRFQVFKNPCVTASMIHRSSVLPTRRSHQGSSYSRHPQL